MTMKRIYTLAYLEALTLWEREHDFLKEHPLDELGMIREERAWNEMNEIHEELLKLERQGETE